MLGATTLITLLTLTGNAQAQDLGDPAIEEIEGMMFVPAIDSNHFWRTEETILGQYGEASGRFISFYTGTTVLDRTTNNPELDRGLFDFNVAGGIYFGQARLGAIMSAYQRQVGPGFDDVGGIGDLWFDVKYTFTQNTSPLGLALDGSVRVPTASEEIGVASPLLSTDEFQGRLQLLADTRFLDDKMVLAFNGGARLTDNLEWDTLDEFLFGSIGAGYDFSRMGGVALELAGRTSYNRSAFVDSAPLEDMVGGWVRPGAGDLLLRAGVGLATDEGWDSTDARASAGITWEPQRRDFDQDGVFGRNDRCPEQAEDFDGWRDDDGCPDDTIVDVRFVDEQGNPVNVESAMLESPTTHARLGATGRAEVSPGAYTLQAQPKGRQPMMMDVQIPDGPPVEIVQVVPSMEEPVVQVVPVVEPSEEPSDQGRLTLRIRDTEGNTVDEATVTIGDQTYTARGGHLSVDVPPGDYQVMIESPQHQVGTADVELDEGERETVQVALQPKPMADEMGRLTMTITDADGNPVELATVRLNGYTFTARDGYLSEMIPAGSYQATVRAPGIGMSMTDVTIEAEGKENVQVALQKPRVRIEGTALTLDDKIYFRTNRAEIDPMSHSLLQELAATLKRNPEIESLRIIGHTDQRGSAGYNRQLSQARAEAVVDFLIRQGVDPQRLSAVGMGEARPVDPRNTMEAYARNRRVEFQVTGDPEELARIADEGEF